MPDDYSRFWPYVIAALAMLLIYRRLRRSFGPQLLRPVRMWVRIGLLTLVGCSLVPSAATSGQFLAAQLAGVLAGAALGVWGARETRYRTDAGKLYYIPHTYSGVAISLLLIGRLVYRLVELYGVDRASLSPAYQPTSLMRSPLTALLLSTVVGYYVCYYGIVLWKSRRLGPEDLEPATPITASSSPASPHPTPDSGVGSRR